MQSQYSMAIARYNFIVEFAGRDYLRLECVLGEYIFGAASEDKANVKANVKASYIYAIEVKPKLGIV